MRLTAAARLRRSPDVGGKGDAELRVGLQQLQQGSPGQRGPAANLTRTSASHSRPEAGQGGCDQTLPEWNDVRAVVEHDTKGKAVAASIGQGPKAAKVTGLHRSACLYLDSDDHSVVPLQHDVNFAHLTISEMIGAKPQFGSGHQLHDLGEDEALQQGAECATICLNALEGQTAHGGEKTGIQKMQLWRLDDAFQRIGEPGLQRRDQENLLKQANIALPRLVRDIDGGPELGVVHQLTGMLRQQPDKLRQFGQFLDVCDIPEIARQDRGEWTCTGSVPVRCSF